MGWSMGGGARWITAFKIVKTVMTSAGHNATAMSMCARGVGIGCPLLAMNGAMDMTILGGMGQSEMSYGNAKGPKILYVIATTGRLSWFTPSSTGAAKGKLALAFQKTYLEGEILNLSELSPVCCIIFLNRSTMFMATKLPCVS